MINKRRAELDIVNDILELTQEKASINDILYKCNMSYTQLQSYLKVLVKKRIICKEENKYIITKKGNECLSNITIVLSYFGS